MKNKSNKRCKFFFSKEGCNNNCKYSHDQEPCHSFFSEVNSCNQNNCQFSHDIQKFSKCPNDCKKCKSSMMNEKQKSQPCHYFFSEPNVCTLNNCKFSHDKNKFQKCLTDCKQCTQKLKNNNIPCHKFFSELQSCNNEKCEFNHNKQAFQKCLVECLECKRKQKSENQSKVKQLKEQQNKEITKQVLQKQDVILDQKIQNSEQLNSKEESKQEQINDFSQEQQQKIKINNKSKKSNKQTPCHSYFCNNRCNNKNCQFSHDKMRFKCCFIFNCKLCQNFINQEVREDQHFKNCMKIIKESLWNLNNKIKNLDARIQQYKEDKEIYESLTDEYKIYKEQLSIYIDSANHIQQKILKLKVYDNTSKFKLEKYEQSLRLKECQIVASLPAYLKKQEIIQQLYNYGILEKKSSKQQIKYEGKNPYCLIIGATGSGKTTQTPQYLYQYLQSTPKKIICVQPRKVAAISLATRIAQEMGLNLGKEVGYIVGFAPKENKNKQLDNKEKEQKDKVKLCSKETKILFITESYLLMKIQNDKTNYDNDGKEDLHLKKKKKNFFEDVGAILLDEIHERSLTCDLIFGFIKDYLTKKYTKMKLYLASATVNQERFQKYFDNCDVITIPGRAYPIEIKYEPMFEEGGYIEGSLSVLENLISDWNDGNGQYKGHILIFLTSPDEMEELEEQINQSEIIQKTGHYKVFQLHGKLTGQEQQAVFQETDKIKIVLATKIAESSITINNVRVVIDSGFDKDAYYDAKKGINVLQVEQINQQSANQRAGRAGRTAPGICIRLYSKETFLKFPFEKTPEIKKVNFDYALLKIKNFGFDCQSFPFFERPDDTVIDSTIQNLELIGAITRTTDIITKNSIKFEITREGKLMSNSTQEPKKFKNMLMASQRGCLDQVIKIIAVEVNAGQLFRKIPKDKALKQKFNKSRSLICDDCSSDHIDYLNIYDKWYQMKKSGQFQNKDIKKWADDNFINLKCLEKSKRTYSEIRKEIGFLINHFKDMFQSNPLLIEKNNPVINILKCILSASLPTLSQYSGHQKFGFINLFEGFCFHIQNTSRLANYTPNHSKEEIENNLIIYSQIDNFGGRNVARGVSLINKNLLKDQNLIQTKTLQKIEMSIKENYNLDYVVLPLAEWATDAFLRSNKLKFEAQFDTFQKSNPHKKIAISASTDKSGVVLVYTKPLENNVLEYLKTQVQLFKIQKATDRLSFPVHGTSRITAVIKDGLQVQELIMPNEFISVSYDNLQSTNKNPDEIANFFNLKQRVDEPEDFLQKQKFQLIQIQQENLSYNFISVNNKDNKLSGVITFVSKMNAKDFIDKYQLYYEKKNIELQPLIEKSQKNQLYESNQIKIQFSLGESLCKAQVKLLDDYTAQMVANHLSQQLIDGIQIKVKQKGKVVYLEQLNKLTDEHLIGQYLKNFENKKIYLERNQGDQNEDNQQMTLALLKSILTQYLNYDQVQNLIINLNSSKGKQSVQVARVTLPTRQIAEKLTELDGKTGLLGPQRIRIKFSNQTVLRVPVQIYRVGYFNIMMKKASFETQFPEINIKVDEINDQNELQANSSEKSNNNKKQNQKNQNNKQNYSHFYKIKIQSDNPERNRYIAKEIEKSYQGQQLFFEPYIMYSQEMINSYLKIEKDLKGHCHIAWDQHRRLKYLTVYGYQPQDTEKCIEQINNIVALIKAKQLVESISLKDYNVTQVHNLFKDDQKVVINFGFKKMMIYGTQQEIQDKKVLIEKCRKVQQQQGQIKVDECDVCLEKHDSSSITLFNCSHKFHKNCIQGMIEEHLKGYAISLNCLSCATPIAIKDLKIAASLDQLTEIIQLHIIQYKISNNKIYKNCKTIDCGQIYCVDNILSTRTCEKCQETYCFKDPNNPHKDHPDEDCESFLNKTEADYQFELLKKQGIIRNLSCCKVDVIKTQGCGHITCPMCGGHCCYQCGLQFPEDEIYDHMGTDCDRRLDKLCQN